MTDREPEPPPEDATAPAGELVLAEEGGVRVFYISAPTMPDLVDRLALVLGEHMHDGDELHVNLQRDAVRLAGAPAHEGRPDTPPRGGLDRAALRVQRVRGPARAPGAPAALTAPGRDRSRRRVEPQGS
jgi:hypothetical protein